MSLFGYNCRFIAVRDASYYYQPYAVTVLDQPYDITCDLADAIVLSNPTADLDSIFVAPTRTDPYAEETDVPADSASTDSVDIQSGAEDAPSNRDDASATTAEDISDQQTMAGDSASE